MSLSEDLKWRGLIKDKTFDDITWLDEPKTFYLGIDASDSSLTIGNLAVIMLARRLMESGWRAVLLAGGATSLVGDPGGKSEERELQSREQIAKNIEGVEAQIKRLFAGKDFELVNNLDWLNDLKYLDFLRDVGKHFPMSELMQREFVDARLGGAGSGISYAEFSYSLLQGYDFWWLFKNKAVVLQIGASDQWGNMLSGAALIRKREAGEANVLSMPLVVNKSTGRKFGKSEDGAIWLDAERTSPTEFYQFWINTKDEDVEDYLKIFTLQSKEEIEHVMSIQHSKPSKRQAHRKLAEYVTILVHGEDGLKVARNHTDAITKPGGYNLTSEYVKLESGISVVDALTKTGLATSSSDARRLVEEKGVYVNNDPYDKNILTVSDFENGRLILRRGKKLQNSVLIELV